MLQEKVLYEIFQRGFSRARDRVVAINLSRRISLHIAAVQDVLKKGSARRKSIHPSRVASLRLSRAVIHPTRGPRYSIELAHAAGFTIKRCTLRRRSPVCLTVGGVGCAFAMQTITRRIARERAHGETRPDGRRRRERENEEPAKYRGKRIVTLSRENSGESARDLHPLPPFPPLLLLFLFSLAASSSAPQPRGRI